MNLEIRIEAEQRLSFYDYGFLHGYGLFETLPVKNGKAVFLREHLERLKASAQVLYLEPVCG